MASRISPIPETERYEAIDVLRGVAVLGILMMNIQSFAMVFAAYFNPTALGPPSTQDFAVWVIGHLLFDQKFMTIFATLFGAGVLLFTNRVAARAGRPGVVHYRRMFWLLIFGLMHAYLLWYGDILVLYAVCGMLPAKVLQPPRVCRLWGRVACCCVGITRNIAAGWTLRYSFFQGAQWNYWGSLLVSLGWTGAVMSLWQSGAARGLVARARSSP